MDLWWCLPWVLRTRWIPLLACIETCMQWILRIHMKTSRRPPGQLSCFIHIHAYKHWWDSSPGLSMPLSHSMLQDRWSTDYIWFLTQDYQWRHSEMLICYNLGSRLHSFSCPLITVGNSSCGKVMFSQAHVKNSVQKGMYPPQADTSHSNTTPPPPETTTAADGTHPTGMYSCLSLKVIFVL